jgi:hypothetical protein
VLYLKELATLYEARLQGNAMPAFEPQRIQYADYAAWQRKNTSERGPVFLRSLQWWRDNLSGATRYMPLPFVRTVPETDLQPADGVQLWGLTRETSNRLNEIAAAQHATHLAVRLAGFAALLAAEAGTPDVIVGLYSTGRRRVQLFDVLGDFSNLLPLRFVYDSNKTFVEWLTLVRKQIEGAERHVAIPHDLLKDTLASENLNPLEVQVIFHPTITRDAIRFGGPTLTTLDRAHQFFPWGFTIEFDEQHEADGCSMLFDPRMYDRAGIEAFSQRLKCFLDAISLDPHRTLASVFGEISKA